MLLYENTVNAKVENQKTGLYPVWKTAVQVYLAGLNKPDTTHSDKPLFTSSLNICFEDLEVVTLTDFLIEVSNI